MQKYKDEYSKQYSCIVKSSKIDKHALCTICSADISISRILPYFGALSHFLNFASWYLCHLLTHHCHEIQFISAIGRVTW